MRTGHETVSDCGLRRSFDFRLVTITRGTKHVLVVNSTPQGAKVKPSNGESCDSTPCNFKVPRKSDLNLVVTSDHCQPHHVRVTNRVAGGGGAAKAGTLCSAGLSVQA